MSFADKVLNFYASLQISTKLPRGVEVLNPYANEKTFHYCQQFYHKFYHDDNPRTMIIGINPGRFGAGLTGIPFIDPPKLLNACGIENDLPMKSELSADFIFTMIQAFGGLEKFYSRFYINSVSPLGFIQNGKNLNYYDTPALLKSTDPFIRQSLNTQINFGINRKIAYCLGEGENFKQLSRINEEEHLFEKIIPLAHPRFIMQYKRKYVDQYIQDYIKKLKFSTEFNLPSS